LGASEIKAYYQELSETQGFDPARTIVGGFSKGGEMALWLALKEIIPLAGFILVNPGGPLIREVEPWLPILENCQTRTEMRGFLVAGEHDANLEQIKALCELLASHGLACDLLLAPGIAHDFPADFDQVLARALDFIGNP
jgi:predicted esterase